MTRSTVLSRDSKKASTLPPARMARRGRLMEVKLRFPRPVTIWWEGSKWLPMTRVRQPM